MFVPIWIIYLQPKPQTYSGGDRGTLIGIHTLAYAINTLMHLNPIELSFIFMSFSSELWINTCPSTSSLQIAVLPGNRLYRQYAIINGLALSIEQQIHPDLENSTIHKMGHPPQASLELC